MFALELRSADLSVEYSLLHKTLGVTSAFDVHGSDAVLDARGSGYLPGLQID